LTGGGEGFKHNIKIRLKDYQKTVKYIQIYLDKHVQSLVLCATTCAFNFICIT